jgi:cytosine permease
MTVPAMYGYRVLKFLYHIIVPVLFVVLVCMLIYLLFFSKTGFTSIFAWRPERPISYLTGITLVVGAWAMGAFTVGDYCRYGKSLRGTALGIFIGLIIVVPVVFMGGALFFILMGQADITVILNGLGFPAVALIFLILGAWNLNMVNAYSGGIVLSVLLNFPEKRLKFCTALTGILGTVLGVAGILSWFTGFLSLLSSLVPPVIGALMGVKMADMLKRRKNGQMKGVRIKPGFHIPGVIAYGCGAFTAWLTTGIVPFFIPPLDGIITAAAVYVMLDIILGRKKG